ncbi:VIT domain-containing protein [Magnetococcales bacterium HHB-1]
MFSFFRTQDRQFKVTDDLPYVAVPENEKEIVLQSLKIQVTVTGLLAETTQTMRFFNPNPRDLEGNLTFPLPDNAVVCGYALDIEGEMVHGVVVPKQEARQILEAEERKGVDPGIVEQVQGNIYRTRIYPIPARGTRTVEITYINDLIIKNNNAAYHLPLAYAAHLRQVSLAIKVIQAPVKPKISGGLGNLSLNRWQENWEAKAKLTQGVACEDLRIDLPNLPEQFITIEKHDSGDTFFCLSHHQAEAKKNTKNWQPKRIAIAWDGSGSRTTIDRDLKLLTQLLEIWNHTVIDLLVFRDTVETEIRTFHRDNEALIDHLKKQPMDGGTNLKRLNFATPPHATTEAWLLFSDGLGNIERGLPTMGDIPIIAITSLADNNSTLLNYLAQKTGGSFVNLLRISEESALHQITIRQKPLHITQSTHCTDLHVNHRHGRFNIMGRITSTTATLQWRGTPSEITLSTTNASNQSKTIGRAWAGLEAQKMALIGDEDSEEVINLGRRFGLVTPGTSLLVLEHLEQYLEYDIEPPASRPEMLKQFKQQRLQQHSKEKQRHQKQIESVINLWQKRITWWETDFYSAWIKKEQEAKTAPRPPSTQPSMGGQLEEEASYMLQEETGSHIMSLAAPAASLSLNDSEEDLSVAQTGDASPSPTGCITIKPWQPNTPYLTALGSVSVEQKYKVYLKQRPHYSESPAFFFDCADHFFAQNQHSLGLRILSNLVEMALENPALLRMYAWRLQQANELTMAITILERVHHLRDDEPQSYRDLALALAQRWECGEGSEEDASRAMMLLYKVISERWNNFPEIEIIALMELNRLIHLATKQNIQIPKQIDSRILRHLDLDIRISMSWDADLTDVDLHVFEPTGEHAYYSHNRTEIGGLVSRDFTQGYGPEEYVLKKAIPGTYTIKAHYYGSSQQSLYGPCTVTVTAFTNFGRQNEKREVLMLRLDKPSEQVLVGVITIDDLESTSTYAPISADSDWQSRFRQLCRGMTINEIINIVGQPDKIAGEQEMTMIYHPTSEAIIHLHIAPKLVSVKCFMDGATLNLL